jgi:hypothetical protein
LRVVLSSDNAHLDTPTTPLTSFTVLTGMPMCHANLEFNAKRWGLMPTTLKSRTLFLSSLGKCPRT